MQSTQTDPLSESTADSLSSTASAGSADSTADTGVLQTTAEMANDAPDLASLNASFTELENIYTETGEFSPECYINRELSTLRFQLRVLAQATNPKHPLLERLFFLIIFSSNLDEFFEIRVAGLMQKMQDDDSLTRLDNRKPSDVLARISHIAHQAVTEQYRILNEDILPALAEHDIRYLKRKELNAAQKAWMKEYYFIQVKPVLTPISNDPAHPFQRLTLARHRRPLPGAVPAHGHPASVVQHDLPARGPRPGAPRPARARRAPAHDSRLPQLAAHGRRGERVHQRLHDGPARRGVLRLGPRADVSSRHPDRSGREARDAGRRARPAHAGGGREGRLPGGRHARREP